MVNKQRRGSGKVWKREDCPRGNLGASAARGAGPVSWAAGRNAARNRVLNMPIYVYSCTNGHVLEEASIPY
jgi:hypothetical protein